MKVRLVDTPLSIPRYRQIRLPTVAAELSPYAEVEINDENIEPIDESPADLVGFTAQVFNSPRAIHLSEKFRARGIKTIVGGPYATAAGKEALTHFDAVVVGEVEGLGERIINDLSHGRLQGLYRLEEPPRDWGNRVPRRDLQQAEKYYRFNYPIEFTRGCPHRCSFCFGPYAYPTFRTGSLDSIGRQLEQWDHGLVEAVDLNFAADRGFLIKVCRLLEEMKIAGWFGEATLRSLDDREVLEYLARSNCRAVFVGIESIEEGPLQSINKRFNQVSEYRRIIRRIQDHGIYVHGGLMWGLDGQNLESFDAAFEFCEQTHLYLASTNIATYYPGTQAHDRLREQSRLLTEDPKKYDSVHVVVEPDIISVDDVYQGAKRFLKRFYSYRSIFKRSFQAPNYDLWQLLSYWGFNRIYRSYYKMWVRRLGSGDTPWPASQEEKEIFPHAGGPMPIIYATSDWRWRFLHRFFLAWFRPQEKASAVLTSLLTLIAAAMGILAFVQVRAMAWKHWPVVWPNSKAVLGVFAISTLVSTWLATRIARMETTDTAFSGRPSSNTGLRSSLKRLYLFFCLAAAFSPPLLCAFAFPFGSSGWSFITAWLTVVFFMKSWSVITAGISQNKNPLRVTYFVLFFPTLDFEQAFVIDHTKKQLSRHYPLALVGLIKSMVGFALLPAFFYLAINNFDALGYGLPGALARSIILYLLLAGILEFFTAYWRMWGFAIEAPFGTKPFGPASLAGLWNRWNLPMRRWLIRHVYLPLGGNGRPLIATAGTFLISGAIFIAMFWPVVNRFPHELLMFFGLNGVVVAMEKKISRGRQPAQPWLSVLYALSVLFLLITARWYFFVNDRIFI